MKDKKKTFPTKREKPHRPPDTAKHMPWVLLFFAFFAFISFLNVDAVHAQKTAPEGLTHNTGPEPAVLLTAEEKAWLKAHPAIRFGFMERYEPYLMTDGKGNQSGILVDLKDELSRRLGVNIVLEQFRTITALLAASENKKIDVVNCIMPQRADKRGLLRTEVFLRSYVAVYTRDGISIKTPDDMAGKTIAIPRDAGYAKQFVQPYIEAVNIIYADTPEDGLRMVHSREADGFVGTTTHNYLINKYRFLGVAQAYVNLDKSTPFAMGIRADWPELAAILNKGLASFGKKGVEDIVARWIQIAGQEKGIDLSAEEQAWLGHNHTVRVRVVDFPPFIIAKEGEEPSGITIDYLHLIAERTGIRFLYDFSTLPFAEALEGLKNRKSPDLITSMMRTPERERFISFSNNYLRTPRVIFARTEAGFISGIGDLIGKVVAVTRGTVVQREIEKKYPGFGLKLFDTDSEALEAVAMGKADAYIGNLTLGSYIILNKGLTNLKIAAPTDLKDHIFSFGVRKDWPELSTIINKGLDTISSEEALAIRNKYLSVLYEHGIRLAYVLKWALGAGGGAFVIVLLFVVWNRQLRIKVRERTAELEIGNKALAAENAERTKVEAALRESRDYLKNLTDSLPDAVFSVKMPERKIEWANDTYNVFGYDPGECVGKTTEFLYPDKKGFLALGDNIAGAITEGKEVFHIEQTMINKSGEHFPADINLSFFRVNENVVSITAIVRNIAERKQREQKLDEYQHRLKALASQLTITEEKERLTIAADLHDHVGHSLALARMQLNGVLEAKSELERNLLVKDISHILLKSLQDTRSLIFELSSPTLNEIGLGAAISELLEENVGKRHGLKTEFIDEIDEKLRKTLDGNVRAVLFRNVRELLTNVIKHAKAEKMSVHLKAGDGMVSVIVEDDGVGFDPQAPTPPGEEKGGYGLFSIRERMADMGGAFEIVSEPAKGCRAVLMVPVGTSKD